MGAGAPSTVRSKREWKEQIADSMRHPDRSVVTSGKVEIREQKPDPSSRSESMRDHVHEENGPDSLRPVPVGDGGGGDDESLSVFSYDNMLDDFADDDASIIATQTSPKKTKKKKSKNSSNVEYLEVQNLEISRVDVELEKLNELNKNASRSDLEVDYESAASEVNRQRCRAEDMSDLDCDIADTNNSVGCRGPGSAPKPSQVCSSGVSDEESEERDEYFDKPMASPANTHGVVKGVGSSPMARYRTRNSGFHAQPWESQNTWTLLESSPGYATAATAYDMAITNNNFDDLQKTKMWSYAQNAQLEREVEVLQRQLAQLEALERGMGIDTSQSIITTGNATSTSEFTFDNRRRNSSSNKSSHAAAVPALPISGGFNTSDVEGSSKIVGSKVSIRSSESEAMTRPMPPSYENAKSPLTSAVCSGSLRLRQPRVHTHLQLLRDNETEGIRKQLSKIDVVSEQDISANSEIKDDCLNSASDTRVHGALGSNSRNFSLNANANMTGATNPTVGGVSVGAIKAVTARPSRKARTEEVMSGNTSGRDDNEKRERGEKADKSDRKDGSRRSNAHRRDSLSVEREQLSKEQWESEARADGTGSANTNNNTNTMSRNSAAANVIARLEEKRLRALGLQGATSSDYNVTDNKVALSRDDGNGNDGRSGLSMLRRHESRRPRNLIGGPRNPRHRSVSGSGEDKSDSDAPADEEQQYSARLSRHRQGRGHSLTGQRQQMVTGPSGERSRETTDDESKVASVGVELRGRKKDSPYKAGLNSNYAAKLPTAAADSQSDQEGSGANKNMGHRSIRGSKHPSRRLSMPAGSTIVTAEARVEQVLAEAHKKEISAISHMHTHTISHLHQPYKPGESLLSSPRVDDSSEMVHSARSPSLGPRQGGRGGEGKEEDVEELSSVVGVSSSHHRRRLRDHRKESAALSSGFTGSGEEEKSYAVSDTKNPILRARGLNHQQLYNASISPEVIPHQLQRQQADLVTVSSSSSRHDENKREGYNDEDRDRDRRCSLQNKEQRKRASRIDKKKKQTNDSDTSAEIELIGWSASLENRWCEVCLLLRKAIATEDDMLYTAITAEAGMMFFDQLDSVSKSLQVMRGTLSRWLLPFDSDTRLDGQCSTPHSVAQQMPEILRGRLSEREVHYLVTGLNSVRKLVRIKIADDNDLEQARQALKTTVDFFKELQSVSIAHEVTAFKLLEKRLTSGM